MVERDIDGREEAALQGRRAVASRRALGMKYARLHGVEARRTDMLLHLPVTAATGLLCPLLLAAQTMTGAAAGALQDAGSPPAALATTSTRLQFSQPLRNLTVDYMPSEYLPLTTDRFVQMWTTALR